jgi:predicted nucleic acid-binding protein
MIQGASRVKVVLDTCCIINLGAAAELLKILPAIQYELWIPSIAAKEVIHIRQPEENNPAVQVERKIDLKPAVNASHLRICELDEVELSLFVQYAAELEDGEAACIAVAKNRGWLLATDDRKARHVAGDAGTTLLSTPELIKAWADGSKASAPAVKAVVMNIRNFARFFPRPGSPLADWWSKHS